MKIIDGGFGGYHGYHGRRTISPLSLTNKPVDDDALYKELKQLELSQSFGDLIKEKKTLITAGQLGPNTACSAINPGVLYQDNEFRLLCRGEADETVWVGDFLARQAHPLWCTLDSNLTIKESFFLRYLELPPKSRAEDWRLFEYQGKLYTNHSVYQLLDRQEWIVRSRPGISEIDLQKRTLSLRCMLEPPFEPSWEEKNWSFFVHEGSLMCLYSFKPYIILEIDLERGITTKLLEVDPDYQWYDKGKFIRNSTNIVPWDDDHYILFIHDFLDPRYEPRNRTYMQYATLISKKTLLPTSIIAEPVQMGGEEGGRHPGVHYTSALVNQDDRLYAFYGQGDSHTGVVVFNKDILNGLFNRVSRKSLNNYTQYLNDLDQQQSKSRIAHEVYVSRRKIWISTLLTLLSFIAPYIYTRRWKSLGIMVGAIFLLGCFISYGDDFETGFNQCRKLAPIFMVLAAIDNGMAIGKYKKKVAVKSVSYH